MDLGKSGLLLGQRVEVTYLPAQQDAAAAISVRLLSEENSLGDEQLKNILCSMTLEEKVAQMFWVRCPEQGAVQAVSDWQIGGFTFLAGILPKKHRKLSGRLSMNIRKTQKSRF